MCFNFFFLNVLNEFCRTEQFESVFEKYRAYWKIAMHVLFGSRGKLKNSLNDVEPEIL